MHMELEQRLKNGTAVIGIVGLGYVGLPLALSFAERYKVVGFDVSGKLVQNLSRGISHIGDISKADIESKVGTTFLPTDDSRALSDCDVIIICVPTPLRADKEPDLDYIRSAVETIRSILRRKMMIILESTTYPSTTDSVVLPMLEQSGLKMGEDFLLAFSPERIDPGNSNYRVTDIPKVVGGVNPESTEMAALLYSSIIKTVYKVTNARTAEAVKMMENVFRNVNIALVNEMALIFERLDIDTWEVIDAAKTKPFGFMPFYPGPGIGGHCIPLDPLYMSYISKRYDYTPRFIEMASELNDFMKLHAVNLLERALRSGGKMLQGSNVCVLGLAYKKNVGDARETPSVRVIEDIVERGGTVKAYDPYIASLKTRVGTVVSEASIMDAARGCDAIILLMDHTEFTNCDLSIVLAEMKSPIIVDCKNAIEPPSGSIYYGIGKRNEHS